MSVFILQSAKHEEILGAELQSLKDQVNLKRSSMNEHVSHLESLREEVIKGFISLTMAIIMKLSFQINLLMGRKMELERRIELLQGEREGLSSTLDESADRIIMLEKQNREQDSLVIYFFDNLDAMHKKNDQFLVQAMIYNFECSR